MATAKKQPSGAWKVRVYSHTDADGKKHYKAFTAPTKQEAERQAAEFSGIIGRAHQKDMTVAETLKRYMDAKENVLSPKTYSNYQFMAGKYFDSINHKKIRRLDNEEMQVFVSGLAKDYSPRTVEAVYTFLRSAINMFYPDKRFRGVILPKKVRKRRTAPENEQVCALFDAADGDLKIAIALAAFGSMRRGEICALLYGDISGNIVHVERDIVIAHNKDWVIKDIPKTSDSVRDILLPDEVIKLIGIGDPDERIIDKTPNAITCAFVRLRNKLGIHIRFHDLRHYYASIGAYLGVPDFLLASYGGWSKTGSTIMKEVYQNPIESMSDKYATAMAAYFQALMNKV